MAVRTVKKYYLIPEDRYKNLLWKDSTVSFPEEQHQTGGEEKKTLISPKQSFEDNKVETHQKEDQSATVPVNKEDVGIKSDPKKEQPFPILDPISQLKKQHRKTPPPGIPDKKKRKRQISWISL